SRASLRVAAKPQRWKTPYAGAHAACLRKSSSAIDIDTQGRGSLAERPGSAADVARAGRRPRRFPPAGGPLQRTHFRVLPPPAPRPPGGRGPDARSVAPPVPFAAQL